MSAEFISFLRGRAQVERQMGTNQLLGGADAGKWRLDRANMYDKCADGYAILESQLVVCQRELESYKLELKKYGKE